MTNARYAVPVALLLISCRDHEATRPTAMTRAEPPHPGYSTRARTPRNSPRAQRELATTSDAIFLGNLEGQVGEAERLSRADPGNIWKLQMLSNLHASHGKYMGNLDEIQLGIDQINRCIAADPKNAELLVDRADQQQALHRFSLARADLVRARALGANAIRVDAVEQELDWNDGQYAKAIHAIGQATARRRNSPTVAREARLYSDLGEQDQADRAFAEAEELIRDTSPLPVAWLNVQRGMHMFRTGRITEAEVFFRAAVDRLPSYVMAKEHLAEALHFLGKDLEAIAIYEEIIARSSDPEFKGALAALYAAHDRTKEADALRFQATADYDRLLERYPEAMYWHAAEFFLAEGHDPKKAMSLLQRNVSIRPNSDSYIALARAELANGIVDAARISIEHALEMPIRSGQLFWTAARVYRKLGDDGRSTHFAARALIYNPVIDTLEPAIVP